MDFGGFQPIIDLVTPFFGDATKALQFIAIMAASVMAIGYKIREMFASVQEDQMFSKKANQVFIILIFIFLAPTGVKVIQYYFF